MNASTNLFARVGFAQVLCDEAQALYLRTEYEQALLLVHQAQRERPHSRLAADGIRRCKDSLNTVLVRKYLLSVASTEWILSID